MNCEAARLAMGADREDDAVRAHVRACASCAAAARDAERGAALLRVAAAAALAAEAKDAPTRDAEDRAVTAVLARFGPPAGRLLLRRVLAIAVAAAVLVAAFLVGRASAPRDVVALPDAIPASWAAHERQVFREVRAALGDDVAWTATVDGTVATGLARGDAARDLRVVFLELRDASGRVLARPRIVMPDGKEALVSAQGLPELRLVASRQAAGPVDVHCSVRFDDGATLVARVDAPESGRSVPLGTVRTGSGVVSVFAAAH